MRTMIGAWVLALGFVASLSPGLAADDQVKYEAVFPPNIERPVMFRYEIDEKAFVFVENDLLIPDRITIVDGQRMIGLDIVQGFEAEGYEPVGLFELPTSLRLDKATRKQDGVDALLRFKQSTWRRGLAIAMREYEGADRLKFTADGFAVVFDTHDRVMRASVVLYRARPAPGLSALRSVDVGVSKVVEAIAGLKETVETSAGKISEAVAGVSQRVKENSTRLADLEKEMADLAAAVSALEGAVASLKK